MTYVLSAIFIAVIAGVFIFDFYLSYAGPGKYILRKLTSGKFPPPEATLFQATIAALVGVVVTLVGVLLFAGMLYLFI